MAYKNVYLTIDDAPSQSFGQKVGFLSKRGIQAIFFCIGKEIEGRESEMLDALDRGFVIGNHSYDHPHFSEISLVEAQRQIAATDIKIDSLYAEAGIRRELKAFRFPYGDKGGANKSAIQDALKALGYRQPEFNGIRYEYFSAHGLGTDLDVFWTLDFQEYGLSNWAAVLERMDCPNPDLGGALANMDSSEIILIHDHANTADLFFRIIDQLIERNIRFERYL